MSRAFSLTATLLLVTSAITACSGSLSGVCADGDPFCQEADGGPGGGGPDAGSCTYDGRTYAVGETFKDSEGCNGCSCTSNGQVACTTMACPKPPKDAGPDAPRDATPDAQRDATPDADSGTWDRCCNNGLVSQCFCPSGMACNYGWFTDCGDGTCSNGLHGDAGNVCRRPDAGPRCQYAGRTYSVGEQLMIDCNYCSCAANGSIICTEMACADAGPDAPPGDASATIDANVGNHYEYCQNGYVEVGYCPDDVSCVPEPFARCENGRCAVGGPCPP